MYGYWTQRNNTNHCSELLFEIVFTKLRIQEPDRAYIMNTWDLLLNPPVHNITALRFGRPKIAKQFYTTHQFRNLKTKIK